MPTDALGNQGVECIAHVMCISAPQPQLDRCDASPYQGTAAEMGISPLQILMQAFCCPTGLQRCQRVWAGVAHRTPVCMTAQLLKQGSMHIKAKSDASCLLPHRSAALSEGLGWGGPPDAATLAAQLRALGLKHAGGPGCGSGGGGSELSADTRRGLAVAVPRLLQASHSQETHTTREQQSHGDLCQQGCSIKQ